MKYAKMAEDLVALGRAQDACKLQERGVKPYSLEAAPLYTAWTREDIAGIAVLMAAMADEIRLMRWLLLGLVCLAVVFGYHVGRYLPAS
jgi:hypothetical protein